MARNAPHALPWCRLRLMIENALSHSRASSGSLWDGVGRAYGERRVLVGQWLTQVSIAHLGYIKNTLGDQKPAIRYLKSGVQFRQRNLVT